MKEMKGKYNPKQVAQMAIIRGNKIYSRSRYTFNPKTEDQYI